MRGDLRIAGVLIKSRNYPLVCRATFEAIEPIHQATTDIVEITYQVVRRILYGEVVSQARNREF